MVTLSSLLVQRGVASMRAVEEAIARQVLHGGDLATAVLEGGVVAEAVLTPLFAESLGLSPAIGRLRPASPEALRLLPSDLAAQHRVFPLELRRGDSGTGGAPDTLVIATSEPLPAAVEEDLAFALAAAIQQVAAPLVRIRQAQAEYYGLSMDRRILRLAARLDGRPDPSPSVLPGSGSRALPALELPAPSPPAVPPAPPSPAPVSPPRTTLRGVTAPGARPQAEPPRWDTESLTWERESPHTVPTLVPPAAQPATDAGASSGAAAPGAGAPGARAFSGWLQRAKAEHDAPQAPAPAAPDAPRATSAARPAAQRSVSLSALGGSAGTSPAAPPNPPLPRGRRRGPFTVAMAEEELARAETTEAVLEVLFDFAQQYFVYTALFAVQGDVAQGRRAAGPGTSAAEVASIRMRLDAPGILAEGRERGAPRVAPLAGHGSDAELSRALGRAPAAAAVVPVSVRGRVVALIYGDEYGDDGDTSPELGEIGELIALAALASPVLERVILRRKMSRQGNLPSAPPPPELRLDSAPAPPAEPAQDDEPGPLSARTRAALLQGLRGRGDVSAFTGAAPQPLDDAWGLRSDEPGSAPRPFVDTWGLRSDEPSSATPPPPRDESQIDTVARAFGLRGTGVEDLAPVSLKSIAGAIRHSADHAGPTPVPPVPHLPHSAASTEFAMAPTIEMPSPRTPSPPALEPPALEPPALEPEPDDEPEAGVHPGSVPERIALSPAGPRRLDRAEPGGRATPGSGFAGLVQAVIEGGEDAPRAISELYRNGEAAMKAIAARFPGPLWIERRARELCAGPGGQEALGRLPPASECGPVLELIVAFRRLALPFMTVRAASPDPETRFWATHVLGELRYPEAANALLPRLFDDDAAVRRVARRAAAALVHEGAPPGKPGSSWAPPALDGSRRSGPHPSPGTPLVQGLEYILRSPDEPLPRKLMAIETAAAIRARALVPALTALLHDPHEFLVDAATRALEAIPEDGAG